MNDTVYTLSAATGAAPEYEDVTLSNCLISTDKGRLEAFKKRFPKIQWDEGTRFAEQILDPIVPWEDQKMWSVVLHQDGEIIVKEITNYTVELLQKAVSGKEDTLIVSQSRIWRRWIIFAKNREDCLDFAITKVQ